MDVSQLQYFCGKWVRMLHLFELAVKYSRCLSTLWARSLQDCISVCRSAFNQEHGNSEALEFLGDAVLGLITTSYIFYCLGADVKKSIEPGQLHWLRCALVKNDTLAYMAARYDLHRCLIHNSTSLANSILQFTQVCCFAPKQPLS
jgi:dsRNA-specific ribonuclease